MGGGASRAGSQGGACRGQGRCGDQGRGGCDQGEAILARLGKTGSSEEPFWLSQRELRESMLAMTKSSGVDLWAPATTEETIEQCVAQTHHKPIATTVSTADRG